MLMANHDLNNSQQASIKNSYRQAIQVMNILCEAEAIRIQAMS